MDKTDETREWMHHFHSHKIPSEELRKKPGTRRPFIFDQRDGLAEREVSLRITAIRETFEELGVVLCRDPAAPSTSPFSSFHHSKDCDIPLWQKKIHNHEESLLAFCEKFKVVPDIMNMYEWSCWLTPTFFRPKRFETMFFLVALNSLPPIYPESHEVQEFSVSFVKTFRGRFLINLTAVEHAGRDPSVVQREEALAATTSICGDSTPERHQEHR